MNDNIRNIRDGLIEAALPSVAFDGWTMPMLRDAAIAAGHEASMAQAVFPAGVSDALDHFADMLDRHMLAALAAIDPQTLRVRDRVRMAVAMRLEKMQAYREAERRALAYWGSPVRAARASRIVWRTADRIWDWAGDTAMDYNRYTKRGLLSGVLGATILVWLNDDSPGMADTLAFLDRRIENVMRIGRFVGTIKPGRKKEAGG